MNKTKTIIFVYMECIMSQLQNRIPKKEVLEKSI